MDGGLKKKMSARGKCVVASVSEAPFSRSSASHLDVAREGDVKDEFRVVVAPQGLTLARQSLIPASHGAAQVHGEKKNVSGCTAVRGQGVIL